MKISVKEYVEAQGKKIRLCLEEIARLLSEIDDLECKNAKLCEAAEPFVEAWKKMHETGKLVQNPLRDYTKLIEAIKEEK